jgi:hypothetical protein
MSKVVNFSELKRKEIKCIIFENKDGKVVVENVAEKINKMLEEIENPIKIYNPNQKQKEEIRKILNKGFSQDGKEMLISAENIILDVLPILSNINLDLNRENVEEMNLIKEIIEDPDVIFERVIIIIKEIIKEIGSQYVSVLNDILEMPKEQREKLFQVNEPELSEKEKKKLELKKQLEELELENN